jgi:putative ABC transport system permease protein
MPLAAVQRLSGQAGDITSATVTVNSIENVAATTTAVKAKLGDTADVVNQQDSSANAIEPLKNIQSIALYSLIGSLVAGSIIIFLTMLMIVRERRREIGVLKAIGASNVSIVGQFVAESLTLTAMGAVVGVIGGVLLSNPILKLMAAGTSSTATNTMGGGRMMRFEGPGGAIRGIGNTVNSLHATLGFDVILYGLAAAVLIAVIGSALPAWTIAKIRPAEVMRGE